ncbi:MAG: DNA translocase FtsK 4TM domain-containing protein, partial [Gemmatimonadota bacterium]
MGDQGEDRTRQILIGIGLIAVGVFTLLSLIPIELLGQDRGELFPTGNVVGPIGAAVAAALVGGVGIAAALVPLLPLIWGLASFGWLERGETIRWSVFFAGLLVFVPPLIAALGYPAGGAARWLAGGFGLGLGSLLSGGLGWLGSSLLLAVLLGATTILVLGLGPFRALARGTVTAHDGVRSALGGGSWALRRTWLWIRDAGGSLIAAASGLLVRGRRERPSLWSEAQETIPAVEEPAAAGAPAAGPEQRIKEKKKPAVQRDELDEHTTSDLPPVDLLSPAPARQYSVSEDALEALGETLVETLSTFKVEGRISGRTTGPVVTQFEVVPASGVKVGKIAALADDLALALKAPSIRIIAPIPGKGAVGVEVPNPERKIVFIREILDSSAYQTSRAELPLALGEDVTGRSDVADLAKMPHLLIAGATGSGKSVCVNALIACFLMHASPEEVRFVMIDPKRVELSAFAKIPHLAFSSITTDVDQVVGTLQAVIHEMETRYRRFSSLAVRNIEAYNRHPRRPSHLPYWVVIIDELADLMMAAPYEVERQICRLAQLARATGIHLIIATQRPSVDVVTGLIKANFPTRIAF